MTDYTIKNEFSNTFNKIMRINPNERRFTNYLLYLDNFHRSTDERLTERKEKRKRERKENKVFVLEMFLYLIILVVLFTSYLLLHSMYYYN